MNTNISNSNESRVNELCIAHNDETALKSFGFWIYLMSDAILFAVLFATYVVLAPNTVPGITVKTVVNLPYVFFETLLLLMSSLTCHIMLIYMQKNKLKKTLRWLIITGLLGIGFLILEGYEFYELIIHGHTPQTCAFLSGFFVLVMTHGLHVLVGVVWIAVMCIHLVKTKLNKINQQRLMCLSFYWHFLDIIWICLFTIVYLMGAMQ